MTNNGKYFTFLFSRTKRSKIFIKKVDVSKRLLQNGLLSFVLVFAFSIFGLGVFGVLDSSFPDGKQLASTLINPAINQLSAQVSVQNKSIDYSRPDTIDEFAVNSGGPFSMDEMDAENAEIEKQLRVIQATSNPSYVPSMWAHLGKINNEFGFRRSPFGGRSYEFHSGMDIDGERGDMVVAPANGTVTEAGWKGGYGNMIEIDHGNGLFTRFGHLSKIDVQAGDSLNRGTLIGSVGSTGRSTGPHLHYELRLGEKPINPRRFLPPEPTEIRKLQ